MPSNYEVAIWLLCLWFGSIGVLAFNVIKHGNQRNQPFRPSKHIVDLMLLINIMLWLLMWCFRFWGE